MNHNQEVAESNKSDGGDGMNKVKLTQEQAEKIEEVKDYKKKYQEYISDMLYERCINGSWIGVYEPLNNLNADEFARAIYIGYEVEPEYKKGDWVKSKIGTGVGKIIHLKQFGYETDFGLLADTDDIRHATPEEIAEEKERRWWHRHGRGVWEFKTRDIVKDKSGEYGFHYRSVHFVDEILKMARCTGGVDIPLENLTLVCFADERKDVKE